MQILSVSTMPIKRQQVSFGVNPAKVVSEVAEDVMQNSQALSQQAAAALRAQALIPNRQIDQHEAVVRDIWEHFKYIRTYWHSCPDISMYNDGLYRRDQNFLRDFKRAPELRYHDMISLQTCENQRLKTKITDCIPNKGIFENQSFRFPLYKETYSLRYNARKDKVIVNIYPNYASNDDELVKIDLILGKYMYDDLPVKFLFDNLNKSDFYEFLSYSENIDVRTFKNHLELRDNAFQTFIDIRDNNEMEEMSANLKVYDFDDGRRLEYFSNGNEHKVDFYNETGVKVKEISYNEDESTSSFVQYHDTGGIYVKIEEEQPNNFSMQSYDIDGNIIWHKDVNDVKYQTLADMVKTLAKIMNL